jgi:sortase (surface protein transpeptidase)
MRAAFAALMVALAVLTGACGGAEQALPPPTAAPPPSDPAPAPAPPSPAAEPVGIAIPSIGVDADVTAVGLNGDGTMETPDFGSAGWYAEGPRPGDPGPAVVVAHVDSRSGPDVFYRLRELQPGDQVMVEQADGTTAAFLVERSEQVDKDELPADRIWNRTSDRALRLITCGGEFDRSVRHYTDNLIVYATAATV